ncbi:hypothetical protein KCP73_00370 [Salmonella enterica subsp. enterica]|nr:hypothetical protein KCP73_00370 [Salmonella enterica subsp. enterica]
MTRLQIVLSDVRAHNEDRGYAVRYPKSMTTVFFPFWAKPVAIWPRWRWSWHTRSSATIMRAAKIRALLKGINLAVGELSKRCLLKRRARRFAIKILPGFYHSASKLTCDRDQFCRQMGTKNLRFPSLGSPASARPLINTARRMDIAVSDRSSAPALGVT